jgi:hypothetical protein
MLVLYDKVVALLANPPSLALHPNFTNLRALSCHLQCSVQRLSCPQSNILGWFGLLLSRPMYQVLSPNPFHLLNNPKPQAVYYGLRTPIVDVDGNPVLDTNGDPSYVPILAINCATQATINTSLCESKTTGSWTKTSSDHVTTCSMTALMIRSSSHLTLISPGGTPPWRLK